MRVLVLCAVLSALLAVCLASPVKTKIEDDSDSSESSESSELKLFEKASYSTEEKTQEINVQNSIIEDGIEEESSDESSDDQSDENNYIKDALNDSSSEEEPKTQHIMEVIVDNEKPKFKTSVKSKRSVDFAPHSNNQLKVKDEGSIKYEKYLKLKHLGHASNLDNMKGLRKERSADSSEESSEEHKNGKGHGDKTEGVAIVKKPDAAPAEEQIAKLDTAPANIEPKPEDSRHRRSTSSDDTSEEKSSEEDESNKDKAASSHAETGDAAQVGTLDLTAKPDTATAENKPKPEGSRRRRNLQNSSEEYQSVQDQYMNEVFIFSNEKEPNSEEKPKNDHLLENNEYAILSNKVLENRSSEEDYAQGCGGNNSNQDDDSNESSDEKNETLVTKL